MPVILPPDQVDEWLHSASSQAITALMSPAPVDWIQCYAVSSYVNNARHEGKECIRPLAKDDDSL